MSSLRLLIVAACLTGAGAATATPISKVIDLLSGLEAQIIKEGEEAAKLKAEKDTYCKDTAVNLGFDIKTETNEVAELEAKIGKDTAAVSALQEKIETLGADLAKDDKDLQAASKIRAQEIGDFEAEEKELSEIIDAIQRAIAILEREMAKSGSAAFVQVQGASGVVQALDAMVKASVFSAADASRLTAFVQSSHESSDGDAGAPAAAMYESKSGSIVDVLEDLLDKAQAQLSDARTKEGNAQHNFEMLKQSLEDSIKYGTKDMEEAKTAMANAGEGKATAEGELADVSKDLADDRAMLEEVTKGCDTYAEEYDAEAKSRAEELAAVQKAKAILQETTGGAAAVSYALPQMSAPSFLQVRRKADHSIPEALRFVRDLARKSNSAALTQLASRIASAARLGAAGGDDPFVKVKGLITDLIAKLEKESAQDAEQKAYCDREMKDAEEKKAAKIDFVERLSTKIDQMTAESTKLKDSVATLQKELAELAATQKAMDDMRAKEKALFLEQKKALEDGIVGIEGAMKVLKEYYSKEKDHEAQEGAATGIIGMLEVCLSDFTKSLSEITAAEDSAQSEYEVTTQDNEVAKESKDQSVKYETKEAAALDKAVVESTADRAATQSELDAVLEYLEKLKSICIAAPETYAQRADRRAKEIEGLKKALQILS